MLNDECRMQNEGKMQNAFFVLHSAFIILHFLTTYRVPSRPSYRRRSYADLCEPAHCCGCADRESEDFYDAGCRDSFGYPSTGRCSAESAGEARLPPARSCRSG